MSTLNQLLAVLASMPNASATVRAASTAVRLLGGRGLLATSKATFA